jgi:hypothetical protein
MAAPAEKKMHGGTGALAPILPYQLFRRGNLQNLSS